MAASIEVNPAGADVTLTRDLVWRGLVMKAENALPFVPAMQECTVSDFITGKTVVVDGGSSMH